MRFSFPVVALLSLAAIGLLSGGLWWMSRSPGGPSAGPPLRIYCAAGLRLPVEAIAKEYEAAYGTQVQTVFGGSGALVADIRAAGGGDLFIAADRQYILDAAKYDLFAETIPIARQHLVIAVPKGNPKQIAALADLLKPGVRLSLPNPEVAAAGKVARELLADEKHEGRPLWEALDKAKLVARDTVNAVANDVKTGAADAGFVWDALVAQYPDLELVSIPLFAAHPQEISLAVINKSTSPARALHFARYLTAADKGGPRWKQDGFQVLPGDPWAETPEITLYSGGMLRPAVEQAVRDFERREGVHITTNYNGCGILLGQIKAGGIPDVYVACDTSFMTPVADKFPEPEDVSSTELVIIAAQDNPKRIAALGDLAQADLKFGICRPEHSALGALSQQLLARHSLWDAVQPNLKDTPSTADRLVEHVVIGSLEAAIVSRANAVRQKEKLAIIEIDGAGVESGDGGKEAIQPIAVAKDAKYPRTARRLMDYIRSRAARAYFETSGFVWRGDGAGL